MDTKHDISAISADGLEVVGYINPANIERMKRGDLSGFMIEDKPDARKTCAVMTVAQHKRIVAALSPAGGGVAKCPECDDRLACEAGSNAIAAQLGAALQRLTFAARTSGGTAGPDAELMAACEQAEYAMSIGGAGRAFMEAAQAVDAKPQANSQEAE